MTLRDNRSAGGTILAVDIGGTKTAVIATTRGTQRTVARASFTTPCQLGPEAIIARVHSEANTMFANAGVDPRSVGAVGCAVPGQVNADGLVIGAGNLEGWTDVPLRALLEQAWNVPAFVEQDANAGALGEICRGVARAMNDFVFLALGTGIGAGIVLGGRIHRGAHHAAGEVGDLVSDVRNLGHERNLATRIGSRTLRRRAWVATGKEVPPAEAIAGAAVDARLAPIALDVADDVAVAVIAIAALLDPEAIVFGGGTAAAGEDLLARVRERTSRELWIEPVLVLAALGEDAQLYGVLAGAEARLDPNFVVARALRQRA